jgi:hypothetical protein
VNLCDQHYPQSKLYEFMLLHRGACISIEPWHGRIESQSPVLLVMDGDGVFECL